MTLPEPPSPRRIGRPRWMDVRVIGGVLLLVVSVVVGAKVVGASSHTTPVWAAAHTLAGGTVLDPSDLVTVEVNLGESNRHYVATSSPLVGRVLHRAVGAGELIPAGGVRPLGDARVVSLAVDADRMAPGVTHGSVVDLYLVRESGVGTEKSVDTRLQESGVTVQGVQQPKSGGLSGAGSSGLQVSLMLSPADANALVRALPGATATLVLHSTSNGAQPPRAAAGLSTDADGASSVGDAASGTDEAGSTATATASTGGR